MAGPGKQSCSLDRRRVYPFDYRILFNLNKAFVNGWGGAQNGRQPVAKAAAPSLRDSHENPLARRRISRPHRFSSRCRLVAHRRVLPVVEFGVRRRQDRGARLSADDPAGVSFPDRRRADAGRGRGQRLALAEPARRRRAGAAGPAEQRPVSGFELVGHDAGVIRVHRGADQHQSAADRRAGRAGAGRAVELAQAAGPAAGLAGVAVVLRSRLACRKTRTAPCSWLAD